MQYVSTFIENEIEKVVVILPLERVPAFNPENPFPQTYAVPDEVQIGWIKDASGNFIEPPANT